MLVAYVLGHERVNLIPWPVKGRLETASPDDFSVKGFGVSGLGTPLDEGTCFITHSSRQA